MNCYVNSGNIYDRRGNPIEPDEKGIVVLEVDNKPRKFVKEKLINWLTKNNQLIPPPKIKVEPKKVIGERKAKTWTRRKAEWKKRTDFTRKGLGITAQKDGIVYGPFISVTKCSEAIGISKSQISKVISGKQKNKTGFEFIKNVKL